MRPKIKINDKNFDRSNSLSTFYKNPYIEWVDFVQPDGLAVFTDGQMAEVLTDSSTYKVGWLLESPLISRRLYRLAIKYEKEFDKILTFSKKLLLRGDKYVFCPLGGNWIEPKNWKIYSKTKNLSIILSSKKDLKGHRLRHYAVKKFSELIDGKYGTGVNNPIASKVDGLKEYRYSIVIENCREDYYFSEKLIDCILAGSIPIYWGCPSIGEFFDSAGIISFRTKSQLKKIIDTLSEEDYESRLVAVRKNFEIAKNYAYTEKHVLNSCRCFMADIE